MNKYLLTSAMVASVLFFTGCNEQIPAGTKGKIMGKNGFQPEIYPPSKVWLDNNIWNINHESLFLVETTTQKYTETITVKLADKMELTFDVNFRGRVINDDTILNNIFNDMKMNDNIVTTDEVYNIYGKMIVRKVSREIVGKYNVDEVHKNFDRLSIEIYNKLKEETSALPIQLSDVTVGNIEYPKVVTEAINIAKQKRMEIEKEQAAVQIALTKAKGQEELAKTQYNIKMLEAKRIADYNKKIAEGVTKDLLELRRLEIQEKMVDAIQKNQNVIYMPMDMMNGTTNFRQVK